LKQHTFILQGIESHRFL